MSSPKLPHALAPAWPAIRRSAKGRARQGSAATSAALEFASNCSLAVFVFSLSQQPDFSLSRKHFVTPERTSHFGPSRSVPADNTSTKFAYITSFLFKILDPSAVYAHLHVHSCGKPLAVFHHSFTTPAFLCSLRTTHSPLPTSSITFAAPLSCYGYRSPTHLRPTTA